MLRIGILGGFLIALLSGCGLFEGKPQLIERGALFGNPEMTQMRLSPDGAKVSYLAPHNGVMNIFIAPAGDMASGKPLTDVTLRGIKYHMWMRDGRTILYEQDIKGDENWRVFSVDVATGEERDLTPYDGVQARIFGYSRARAEEIVVGLNRRDPRWHDAYLINVRTGDSHLIEQNDRFVDLRVDNDLAVRFGVESTAEGGARVFEKRPEGWVLIMDIPPEDELNFKLYEFEQTNKFLYFIDSRGRNTTALMRLTPSTGETVLIGASDAADIQRLLIHPVTGQIQAYAVSDTKREWIVIDPDIEADLVAISTQSKGEFLIVDRSDNDANWVVHVDRVTEPTAYHIYARSTKTLGPPILTRPALQRAKLQPMHVAEIKARDGLRLVSYYTLPKAADPDGDGKANRPVPLALVVHGGPWQRDEFGFNAWHQWLANRGYAVLSVNFRGSAGFGKAFLNAADREWGGKMQDDLIDATHWAIDAGIAEKEKIAIIGGSYGGYAALAALAFQPDEFACGASIVGPLNLVTLLESIPPYWAAMNGVFEKRVGNRHTSEGLALLESRSPYFHTDRIRRPVLIAQGGLDPRVKMEEADRFVRLLKSQGTPVSYLLYPDEGHSFRRPENHLSFYAAAEAFLGKCLGGAIAPIHADFEGSSLKVIEGADHVPGLSDAIAAMAAKEQAPRP